MEINIGQDKGESSNPACPRNSLYKTCGTMHGLYKVASIDRYFDVSRKLAIAIEAHDPTNLLAFITAATGVHAQRHCASDSGQYGWGIGSFSQITDQNRCHLALPLSLFEHG
jgi:hypothetical protein